MGLRIVIEDVPVWVKNFRILSIPPGYSFIQRLVATEQLKAGQLSFKLSILLDIKIYAYVALDLPFLFKETTLSHPQSLYKYGTMYMYVQLQDNYKKTSCHIP